MTSTSSATTLQQLYKVLVVEDLEVNQELARQYLQKYDCSVDLVSNGSEAIDAFEKESYDLILMDIDMPIMDGLEATRQIRFRESVNRIPIVAFTSMRSPEEIEKMESAGIDFTLFKPCKEEDFPQLLKIVFSNSLKQKSPFVHQSHAIESKKVFEDLDITTLVFLTDNKSEKLKARFSTFKTSMNECISIIELALQSEDLKLVKTVAHKNASAASVFDNKGKLGELLSIIEEHAKSVELAECLALIPELKKTKNMTLDKLERYIRTVV